MNHVRIWLICVAAFAGAACRPDAPPPAAPASDAVPAGPIRFADVSAESGVTASARNGEEAGLRVILESLGTGVGLFDFDGDGRLDLFAVGGGRFETGAGAPRVVGEPNRLYRNLGGFRFEDVSDRVGLGRAGRYSHGCAVGDFDADGDSDVLVAGYGGVALLRNDAGRTLVDVTERSGLDRAGGWCTSAAWGDFDGDGRLDLYVVRYVDWSWSNNPPCRYRASGELDVCAPSVFNGLTDLLFRNLGDGRFEEVGARAGLAEGGKGLGVVAADLDGDRRIDLYVANDTSGNRVYRNLGGLRFEEAGVTSGAALGAEGIATGSMGVDAGDGDGDGDLDLFVSNYEGEINELYRNEGNWIFTPSGMSSGAGAASRPMVGWGTHLADFDGDGRLDLFTANGHLMHRLPGTPRPQRPSLFRRTSDGGPYLDAAPGAGLFFARPRIARGSAVGDLDGDGDLDLVVATLNGPPALLRNDSPARGPALTLRLEGTRSNRSAVGAVVVVEAGGRRLTRAVKGGGSYLSHSDDRLYFGLDGAGAAERVEIRWPSGATDRAGPLEAGRPWLIREGEPPRRASVLADLD